MRPSIVYSALIVLALCPPRMAGAFEQLIDLTGKVNAIVTLKARDNFSSEYRYDISVRNLSPDTWAGDSLIVVLDRITNLAGEERQSLNNDTILSRFEVLGEDGETADGKPFFRIPPGPATDLAPQAESLPAIVRIRNKEYLAVFTPSFRVYGMKRAATPELPRRTEAPAPPTSAAAQAQASRNAMDRLIQLLIKKGVVTEEEWRKANQP